MPSYHVLTYDPQWDSTLYPSDIVVISSDHSLKRWGYTIVYGIFHWMKIFHVRTHSLGFPNWERYVFLMNWKFRLDRNPYSQIYVKSRIERNQIVWLGGLTPQGPFGHTKVLSDRWDSRTRTTACAMVSDLPWVPPWLWGWIWSILYIGLR